MLNMSFEKTVPRAKRIVPPRLDFPSSLTLFLTARTIVRDEDGFACVSFAGEWRVNHCEPRTASFPGSSGGL